RALQTSLDRQVALKVLHAQNAFTARARRRFAREARAIARLNHPHIAGVYDLGVDDDHRTLWLAMELIEGDGMTRLKRESIDLVRLLSLSDQILSALSAAHARSIIHRDLKPSNILVTADGLPKLLDFGISKLLEADDPAAGTALTLLGQRVLTPEYASPEQVRDEPITTGVDIYALGLLLHRLLTSDRPYALPTTRGEALRKAICETPAERPSVTVARLASTDLSTAESMAAARSTEPRRLRRRLAGDLDHIVSKALRKEPSERYVSVELLSADIDRHLEGLPVEARRGGWRYRTGRFLRRHRVAVVAGVAVVLALAAGLVGQTREAERANREAERATLEATTTARVADFLVTLFDASDPMLTREVLTGRQLLDRGVERIHDELSGEPLIQARLMSTLGRVYHNQGLFAEAEPLFATALERRQEVLKAGHPDIATSHLDLADDLRTQGRLEAAMPHYEQAVSMRRKHFGTDSIELAEALNNMALGLIRIGDYDRAQELLQSVYEIRRQKLGEHNLTAQSLHNLTLIASRRGDDRTAVATGRQTLELKSRILPSDHPSTGRTFSLLAGPVRRLGDFPEAERLLQASLEIVLKSWDETHVDVLGIRGDLAFVRHLLGDWEAA
ncbi:MAG: serine/threonine-protein kinase, partial [Planctomycetota bacterium]